MTSRRNFIKGLSIAGFLGLMPGKQLLKATESLSYRHLFGSGTLPIDGKRLCGPLPIISTPFLESGMVDFETLEKEAVFIGECGCSGAIWPQSEDSYDLLSNDEKKEGIEHLLKAMKGRRAKAIVGCQGKDKAEMLEFAEFIEKAAKKYNDDAVIISRPPDNGKTEEDLIEYYTALGRVATHPVIIQTGGGTRYKGPMPSVKMLVDLAKQFPETFGYIKEESGNASERIAEEVKEKPVLKTIFSAMGGTQWLYQGRQLGSEGLITERPAYSDLIAHIWERLNDGDSDRTLDDAFAKLLLMVNLDTLFPGEGQRTGMRWPHIYILKKRGIFKNCISRAWEIKDGKRAIPEKPIVVEGTMTQQQKDEVESRFESLGKYLIH